MYPSTTKFQARPASPQFPNIAPPDDYPHSAAGMPTQLGGLSPANAQHPMHPMMMRHTKTMASKSKGAPVHGMSSANTMSGMMAAGGSIGHHRGDLIFSDDLDSIEFCMPPPPAPTNGIGHGINGDMMLMHGNNGLCTGEAFTERRRRGHGRRSNHKMDVEQQVKWSRKNIAATMERFEPTAHSSSSTSSLEYGFAAGVVTPSTTPLHQPQISPSQLAFPSTSAGAVGGATLPNNHVYSYAYYEPGAAKCHTNIPYNEIVPAPQVATRPSKSPPRNSIRALLSKSFRSKSNSGQSTSSSPSTEERHNYTTRYGTTENLYEEVNEQKIRKVLSDNRIATLSPGTVKEELRRVQHNHFRVLDELNLSLEALIMPPTPPDISPNHVDDDNAPTTSAAAAAAAAVESVVMGAASLSSSSSMSQRPRRGGLLGGASSSSSTSSQQRTLSHASLENLSSTLHSMELKDHAHSSCINPDFDEGDLDSGFSGSGSSSGASYNESVRYYKSAGTAHTVHNQPTTLPHNLRSCRSSTASGTSTSKSSMASADESAVLGMMTMMGSCGTAAGASLGPGANSGACHGPMAGNGAASPFNYAQRCSDVQRASARSAMVSSASTSSSTATGTKPKKNFWTIKP